MVDLSDIHVPAPRRHALGQKRFADHRAPAANGVIVGKIWFIAVALGVAKEAAFGEYFSGVGGIAERLFGLAIMDRAALRVCISFGRWRDRPVVQKIFKCLTQICVLEIAGLLLAL